MSEPEINGPEINEQKGGAAESNLSKISLLWPALIALAMFCAALWAGGEIAKGEIAQQQLDSITAKGNLVRVRVKLPAGAVIDEGSLEAVETFANRVEPYCITGLAVTRGKKTKYGLEPGQILTVRDLE